MTVIPVMELKNNESGPRAETNKNPPQTGVKHYRTFKPEPLLRVGSLKQDYKLIYTTGHK